MPKIREIGAKRINLKILLLKVLLIFLIGLE